VFRKERAEITLKLEAVFCFDTLAKKKKKKANSHSLSAPKTYVKLDEIVSGLFKIAVSVSSCGVGYKLTGE
jgi:hypothetical protein